MNTRSLGSSGEDSAVDFLTQKGWKILERNRHFRFGEVDILADCGDFIVIVEVKAKRSSLRGEAVEMVTVAKQRTLTRLAQLLQTKYNKPVRIDVIAIDGFGTDAIAITHYPFAVGE